MFIVTQLIGLAVIHAYSPQEYRIVYSNGTTENITVQKQLPYGMQPPEVKEEIDFWKIFPSMIIAFVIAISLVLLLSKIKAKVFIRLWFFVVIILALSLTFYAFLQDKLPYASYFVLILAIPLAYIKVFRQNFLVHNFTELLIYPGIAAVFVPILSIWTIIILLVLISIYDIWAVWHTGFMQKMAKFQINEVKVFGGFFIPYISKSLRAKLKKLPKSKLKKKKIKVSLAILGGGDVVFPIIFAGVVLRALGWVPALFVTLGAVLAVLYLFLFAKKDKAYPAMPYITIGTLAALALAQLVF